MANIQQPSIVVPNLVGQQANVMGGAAETVANLVRQGLITPQEIADRMVQRKGAEQQNQLRAEQLTPEAVQTRQAQTQLQGETAKAGMEILPLQTQAAKMTAQDAIKDQEFGGAISAYRKLAPLVGQTGGQPTLPDGSPDYATMAAKGAEWQQAFVQQQIANERLKVAERVQTEGPAGEKGVKFLNALGEDVTPDPGNQTFQGYAKQARAFESFRALPKGGSATSAVTPVEGVGAVVPATSGYNPQMGMTTGAAPKKEERAPTETQQRALQMMARSKEANAAFARLKQSGFDPAALTQYIEQVLPNVLKSGNRQEYEAAMQAWAQGILRLESGAAISVREQSWYEKTFFPQPGDKPQTVQVKDRIRGELEQVIAQIAGAGPIPGGVKEDAKRAYEQARDSLAAQVTSAEPGAGAGVAGATAIKLSSGRTIYKDAQGRSVGLQNADGSWAAGGPAGTAPAAKGAAPIVTPKAKKATKETPPSFQNRPLSFTPSSGGGLPGMQDLMLPQS